MSKLIKYEFRKSLFSQLVFAGITAVMEIIYLIGILGNYNKPTVIGMIGLFFTALAGITFIGIESILILYRDLTTKQSYMLFMTPNNSYKILGAKALENAFSVLLSGIFFGVLAALDFWLLLRENGGFQDLIDMVTQMLKSIDPRLEISAKPLITVLFLMLCSWILKIVTGYLAVVISCTLLSGKKAAGVISFALYIAISLLTAWGIEMLPDAKDVIGNLLIISAASLVCSVVMYFITAWIMDKKLSV